MYPVPDDVTPLKTEEIVRYGRCEMRSAVIDRISAKPGIPEIVAKVMEVKKIDPSAAGKQKALVELVRKMNAIVEEQQEKNREAYYRLFNSSTGTTPHQLKKKLKELKKKLNEQLKERLGGAHVLRQYLDVAVVYEFEFEITEQNQTRGDLGFKLPLISQTIDADASAALLLTRKGKRTFKTQDNWGRLILAEELCKEFSLRSKTVLYPLGGSIGVERVVATFADLIDQGGSKDSFVDALVFTTEASGGVNATIKLSPVPQAFRLVSAGAHFFGSRVDVHKLTLSLVFPKQESSEAIFGVDRFDGDLDTPFDRPADWRARYNLCVADARAREDTLKQLRETAPEIYCIQYADAFDPQYGLQSFKKDIGITVKVDVDGKGKTNGKSRSKSIGPSSPSLVPEARRRPNY